MWILIPIIGVAIILFYVYNNNNRLDKIASDGGIHVKYATLLRYMLDAPGAQIESKGKDYINIVCRGTGVNTYFNITAGFDTAIVKWEMTLGVNGSLKHTWQFPESRISQEQMIVQINKDIEEKCSKVF